jgi:hypothetical protein
MPHALSDDIRERIVRQTDWEGTWPFASAQGRITCAVEGGEPRVAFVPDEVMQAEDGDGEPYGELHLTSNEWVMWNQITAADESFAQGMESEDLIDALKPFIAIGESLCAQPGMAP